MAQAERRTAFAGLDSHGDVVQIPDWYSDKLDLTNTQAAEASDFREVINGLARAEVVTPGYRDPDRDEWVRVADKVAVVNPEWLGDALDDTTRGDALWTFRSDSYEPVNPMEMYGPLIATARQQEMTEVFGEVREHRAGGEVVLDMIFPNYTVGEGDQYVLGLTTGYSHYGDTALWTEVIAFDTTTGTEMRELSDRMSRVHVGEAADETAAYHESSLEAIEQATETLAHVINEARTYTVPFDDELPYNVRGFFEGLKLPQYIAEAAADALVGEGETCDPDEVTAWSLYEACASAITSEFDGADGSALRRHNRKANDVLFSPPSAESKVINYWQNELAGQDTLDPEDENAKVALGERYDSTQEMVEAYQDTKETMKKLVKEATNDED